MLSDLFRRVSSYRRFLRLTPFDESTSQGSRDERYRRALLSSLTMTFSRGASLVAGLFTIYIAAPTLGSERFGAWNTLISIFSLALIFDFGIPAALVNRTAQARIEGQETLTRAISAACAILVISGIIVSILWIAFSSIFSWRIALNSQNAELLAEIRWAAMICAPILFLQFLNTGITNILLGLQRGFLTNIATMLVNVCTMGTTLLAMRYAPNPAGFLWATNGITLITALMIVSYLHKRGHLHTQFTIRQIRDELRVLWSISRPYFVINILMIITANLDIMLASSLLDPHAVSELALVQRLFQVLIGLNTVFTMPLWGAYADAHAKGDHRFIKLTLIRSLSLGALIIAILFPFIFYFSGSIFAMWTHNAISPDRNLIYLVSISTALGIFFTSFSIYLNGCSIMKPQVTAGIIHAIASIPLKIGMALLLGIQGIVLAGIIAPVFAYALTYGVLFRHQTFGLLNSHNAA